MRWKKEKQATANPRVHVCIDHYTCDITRWAYLALLLHLQPAHTKTADSVQVIHAAVTRTTLVHFAWARGMRDERCERCEIRDEVKALASASLSHTVPLTGNWDGRTQSSKCIYRERGGKVFSSFSSQANCSTVAVAKWMCIHWSAAIQFFASTGRTRKKLPGKRRTSEGRAERTQEEHKNKVKQRPHRWPQSEGEEWNAVHRQSPNGQVDPSAMVQ